MKEAVRLTRHGETAIAVIDNPNAGVFDLETSSAMVAPGEGSRDGGVKS